MGQGDDDDTDDDDQPDYMQMQVHEPAHPLTYSQRRLKRVIAGEEKGRVRPQAEVEREKRRTALETPLAGGVGSRMMQKMGYGGGALGVARGAETTVEGPVVVQVKEDRGGIGHETLLKRKLADAADAVQKMQAEVQEGYLGLHRSIRDARKTEKQLRAAQDALETLEVGKHHRDPSTMPAKEAHVLWRERLVEERQTERRRLVQKEMLDAIPHTAVEDEEADEELKEFMLLDKLEQLERVLAYLRCVYYYCFYCGIKYDDEDDLAQCPGVLEDDHD